MASIAEALTDPDLQDHYDTPLADKLAITGKAVLDDVVRVHTSPSDDGEPLRGGAIGREWAERVVEGVMRERAKSEKATLDKYGYDPDKYSYAGITDADNEDLVTTIIRIPVEDSALTRSEALTASGWLPAEFDFTAEDQNTYGIGLDADLFAFTAAALIEDDISGVLLNYAEPLCFLDDQPLLASAPTATDQPTGNVYAIVDATDTSAVVDLIMMRKGDKGPQVYRRNGGKWQLDTALLDAFYSPTPPPIVELTGLYRNQIMAQVDASNAAQINTVGAKDGQGRLDEGAAEAKVKPSTEQSGLQKVKKRVDIQTPKPELLPTPGEPAPPENREKRTPNDAEEGPNSRPPVTAAILNDLHNAVDAIHTRHADTVQAASDWYYSDEGYAQGYSLVAGLQQADQTRETALLEARSGALLDTLDALTAARALATARTNVVIPALLAALNAPTTNTTPNQLKAEQLRKYWLRGKGAVKIRWGTSGDFTRCTRQLRKHLGARAEGYCARRHRESNGFFPGDKRNK